MEKTKKIFMYIVFVIFAFNIFASITYALGVTDGTLLLEFDSLSSEEKCRAILGSPTDETSTIFLLQQIFDVMKFAAPILVLVFSTIDFVKAVASQDKDMLSKATKRTMIRVIVGLVVFVVPIILNYVFEILGWVGTCSVS